MSLPLVENRQQCEALTHRTGLITIIGLCDHVRLESVIMIDRNAHFNCVSDPDNLVRAEVGGQAMKVLLTGGAGDLGQTLAPMLLNRGSGCSHRAMPMPEQRIDDFNDFALCYDEIQAVILRAREIGLAEIEASRCAKRPNACEGKNVIRDYLITSGKRPRTATNL